MKTLDSSLRGQLEQTVIKARRVAESGAAVALKALAVPSAEPFTSMDAASRDLRVRLRAHARQLGDLRGADKTQGISHLVQECAYAHWHRMLFARFLAENDLLIAPEYGVAVTLEECQDLAQEQGIDKWLVAGKYVADMLPEIFNPRVPTWQVAMPPEAQNALDGLLDQLPSAVFLADDALGWTYQFWQSDEKDRVNKSKQAISAETLPAVTQLFTEDYMVRFLLDNTVGAWHATKVLATQPELAGRLETEQDARDAAALEGYQFDYLRFVRSNPAGGASELGAWRPAAGAYERWPRRACGLKVLDPACGSGHFLVAVLELLVRLRVSDEELTLEDAVTAVLRDNLFGLELDARCTQIAAFNLALAAWKTVGHHMDLPPLNIACSGLSVGRTHAEWVELAGEDSALRDALDDLYRTFEQAPELGSLIEPLHIVTNDLFALDRQKLFAFLDRALAGSADQQEIGVAAQGMAKASQILSDSFTLVITNPPYLHRSKQSEALKKYCALRFKDAKNDLATAFLERCLRWCGAGSTTAVVMPQNWLFLTTYTRLREKLLTSVDWVFLASLGAGAFDTITGEVVKPILLSLNQAVSKEARSIATLDASSIKASSDKAELLRSGEISFLDQEAQLRNPDARIAENLESQHSLLAEFASAFQGVSPADARRFGRCHWEFQFPSTGIEKWQGAPSGTAPFGGEELVIRWGKELDHVFATGGGYLRGKEAWGRAGITLGQMRSLPCCLYSGERFNTNCAVIIPHDPADLPAIWCFCSSPEYSQAVRRIDQSLKVTNDTLVKVPFDAERWRRVAEERYPEGLPRPYSDDPTQWIFHGHPRVADYPLQVAVARLVGYRWPAEVDETMDLSEAARRWVVQSQELGSFADRDGIVCLAPVKGEEGAAARIRALLTAACGEEWTPTREGELVQQARTSSGSGPVTLEEWLRDEFFAQHCGVFGNRPFVWHIWDGRKDGFHALVNYHRLVGPGGGGRRTLEALTYAYLGDWLDRQRDAQRQGVEGADGRVEAAFRLQKSLEDILAGSPPYDIFVRWKPLHRQAIGWEPDVDDGVRMNIRPFMMTRPGAPKRGAAGILRKSPAIKWTDDRGHEQGAQQHPRDQYPWLWGFQSGGDPGHQEDFAGGAAFDGRRWNDVHYSREAKERARAEAARAEIGQ